MSLTIMHFSDGSTLTDKEIWPHELSEEDYQKLTSVERVIRGWHLSILKSPCIRSFFHQTTAYQDMMLIPGRHGPPPKISARALGCYLSDGDPPVRLTLSMEPKSHNVSLDVDLVSSFRPDGFAKPLHRKKLRKVVQKELDDVVWTITNQPPVKRIYSTKEGIGCIIEVTKPGEHGVVASRVMAELRRVDKNCQLIIQPG
jgi:hypothetical protein